MLEIIVPHYHQYVKHACEPNIAPTCVLNLKNHKNLDLVIASNLQRTRQSVVCFSLTFNWFTG